MPASTAGQAFRTDVLTEISTSGAFVASSCRRLKTTAIDSNRLETTGIDSNRLERAVCGGHESPVVLLQVPSHIEAIEYSRKERLGGGNNTYDTRRSKDA